VDQELRSATKRPVRDRIHIAHDDVGLVPGLEQRVGAAVDGDQHRLEVPDIRPHDPKVSLVTRPACDDKGVAVAKPGA
jgi:hypothetical protein